MAEEELAAPQKGINNGDVISSAALTGVILFVLLTWSKLLSDDSTLSNFLSEELLSFVAGVLSYCLTQGLAFIRYELNLKRFERKYVQKIDFINRRLEETECSDTRKILEAKRKKLILDATDEVMKEK